VLQGLFGSRSRRARRHCGPKRLGSCAVWPPEIINYHPPTGRPFAQKAPREGNMSEWMSELKNDCPKRDVPQLHDSCDLICPDLPKVV